ncbi:MAG: hypothetical protein KJ558_10495 [Gammaproteobacteria bacterium]|nr:hypothetical protein [Gammaproteobacteria bacterium]MBU1655236.1 hypothetical protein [Gammaproteobacteria bacterium]MBU1961335.1 hypothetical protein [Gammaproteobacteria bacterium]
MKAQFLAQRRKDAKEINEQAKQIGGIWRPQHKLWELSYAQIAALGIQDRIVGEG